MKTRGRLPCPRTSAANRSGQRGATLIEFALVVLALVMLMFGGIEADRMILVYTNLADAAAVGVRYAVLQSAADDSGTQTAVKNFATGLDTSGLTITVTYSTGDNSQAAGSIGSKVNVKVEYPYVAWVSGVFPSGLKLTAISEGVMLY
jgi:Flp pilus assembly protein TadG